MSDLANDTKHRAVSLRQLSFLLNAFEHFRVAVVRQGAMYPGLSAMWGQWAPPMERSRLALVSYTGNDVPLICIRLSRVSNAIYCQ